MDECGKLDSWNDGNEQLMNKLKQAECYSRKSLIDANPSADFGEIEYSVDKNPQNDMTESYTQLHSDKGQYPLSFVEPIQPNSLNFEHDGAKRSTASVIDEPVQMSVSGGDPITHVNSIDNMNQIEYPSSNSSVEGTDRDTSFLELNCQSQNKNCEPYLSNLLTSNNLPSAAIAWNPTLDHSNTKTEWPISMSFPNAPFNSSNYLPINEFNQFARNFQVNANKSGTINPIDKYISPSKEPHHISSQQSSFDMGLEATNNTIFPQNSPNFPDKKIYHMNTSTSMRRQDAEFPTEDYFHPYSASKKVCGNPAGKPFYPIYSDQPPFFPPVLPPAHPPTTCAAHAAFCHTNSQYEKAGPTNLDMINNLCPTPSWNGMVDTTPSHFMSGSNQHPEVTNVRRRNATRESTATLKGWLQEHIKNPYPTKGEKIMLAIITKMTLTQVSTWFANARRRLKKENKMTWTPKNRGEDANEDDNPDFTSCSEDEYNNSDEVKQDSLNSVNVIPRYDDFDVNSNCEFPRNIEGSQQEPINHVGSYQNGNHGITSNLQSRQSNRNRRSCEFMGRSQNSNTFTNSNVEDARLMIYTNNKQQSDGETSNSEDGLAEQEQWDFWDKVVSTSNSLGYNSSYPVRDSAFFNANGGVRNYSPFSRDHLDARSKQMIGQRLGLPFPSDWPMAQLSSSLLQSSEMSTTPSPHWSNESSFHKHTTPSRPDTGQKHLTQLTQTDSTDAQCPSAFLSIDRLRATNDRQLEQFYPNIQSLSESHQQPLNLELSELKRPSDLMNVPSVIGLTNSNSWATTGCTSLDLGEAKPVNSYPGREVNATLINKVYSTTPSGFDHEHALWHPGLSELSFMPDHQLRPLPQSDRRLQLTDSSPTHKAVFSILS